MFKSFHRISIMIILVLITLSVNSIAQILIERKVSNGPIPNSIKHEKYPDFSGNGNIEATVGFGYANIALTSLSLPMPAGTPITPLTSYTFPNATFASSMVKGGDGNYYITTIEPALYQMDPGTGIITLHGTITGLGADQPNGISYNPANSTYYMVSSNNFFTIDISTRIATLVGALNNTDGAMVDLCFDASGTCYAFDVGLDNAYTINIGTGNATLLGPIGYDANYGQGMAYDFETSTIYLSAFNGTTATGQLRTMDPVTGATTLVVDWGFEQIAPFELNTQVCPVGSAFNPTPSNGTTGVNTNAPGNATWTNGAGTSQVEVFFGPAGNVVSVYSGASITSLAIPSPLLYNTTYEWRVVCKNDTCSGAPVAIWSFTTVQDPFYTEVIDTLYPQAAQYWTGSTDGTNKTDGEVRGANTQDGWFTFDVSSIPDAATIMSVNFNGYVNSANWPYWSATPLPGLNPLTATASELKTAIQANSGTTLAYLFSNESGSFTTGWKTYPLAGTVSADLQAALGQGWFAMGMDSRDNSANFFINWDGWSQTNVSYIVVHYSYITPVELTSFEATTVNRNVTLNWQTATELNNTGFDIQRKSENTDWQKIGFVNGSGTTTEATNYSYVDNPQSNGLVQYRLKQVDFDGTYDYSQVVEVNIGAPAKFELAQNYPNPFNPVTSISFSIPSASSVKLTIYNQIGEKVAELLNENLEPGVYSYNWNASKQASGIYFYELQANEFKSVRKMTLIK
ncbi:MAG: T9SS type A sorting domain-containing protein [Ignavibacteriaceae bacterium]|nr:T9SS type A sorting domain-containing protein [Ignavibacteriaceae bacterium]